jgi:Domain of unknown function (DUF4258)
MELLDKTKALAKTANVRILAHAFDRLRTNKILSDNLLTSMDTAELLEEYPDYHAGQTVLLLHYVDDAPVHAVWGIEKGTDEPLVLVTAYRPDAELWSNDFRKRKP